MTAVVTGVATPVIHILDWNDFTKNIRTDDHYVHVFYTPSDGTPLIGDYRRISYNFVFLAALILAVPDIRPRLRIKILLIALAILFPLHVLRVVVFVLNHYGQHMRSGGETIYPLLYRKALFYTYRLQLLLDGYLTPVVIWAGLMFYYKWSRSYLNRIKPA